MAEGVNQVTKGAIRHGSRLTFCLRNPQNLGICRTKILMRSSPDPFFPVRIKKKKSGLATRDYFLSLCDARASAHHIVIRKRSGYARLFSTSILINSVTQSLLLFSRLENSLVSRALFSVFAL